MASALQNPSSFNESGRTPSTVARKVLFSDLNLKFIKHPVKGDITPLTDIDAIKNAVKNLVLTNFYERPFQPFLGSDLSALLFENATVFTAHKIRNQILRVLDEYEPRVNDIQVQVWDNSDANAYSVTIAFSIIGIEKTAEINFFLKRLR